MSSIAHLPRRSFTQDMPGAALACILRPVHAVLAAPESLFLVTLSLMLFHPPDVPIHSLDRISLALLVLVVLVRAWTAPQPLRLTARATWPMLLLTALAFFDAIRQPYTPETWSLFVAKWLAPFVLFHAAALVFDDQTACRRFETYGLIVLAYLSAIAVLFLADARPLIFPPYILNEGLGIHADRARGPFLQAVANGMALNLLGLLALDSYRRKRLRGLAALLLLAALPAAVLATRTRAVWLSFAASIGMLFWFSADRRLRRACLCLVFAGVLGLLAALTLSDGGRSFSDRLEESGPVKFRLAVYEAGWEMFEQKPLSGWGAIAMKQELSDRISDFHQEEYYFHNTYLEVLVQYGLPGLGLYVWMAIELFRLGRRRMPELQVAGAFADEGFRSLWLVLLAVYLLNGTFVVMNYQFVNGLLFTLAGMLLAQERQSEASNASG